MIVLNKAGMDGEATFFRDDILDMEELFYMLTNFREKSLMPC